jgi:hypothetical protein
MATASVTYRESSGSLTRHIFTLANVATSDTFSSGLNAVFFYSANITSGLTIASVTSATPIQISESSGTFTLTGGRLDGKAVTMNLNVLSRC